MAEIWAAAGALVAAGTAAYSAYNASQTPDASDVFGKKPKIAPYTPIDLSEEQKKAAASNLANIGSIADLLEGISPGFMARNEQVLANADAMIAGEVPENVREEMMRAMAEQANSGIGFPSGTQGDNFKFGRNIGLTSLDLMQRGQNSAQMWEKQAREAFKPYLITTEDEVAAAAANNAGEQATKQYQFNVDAAADPAAAGAYNLQIAQNQQMQQALNSFSSLMSNFGRSGGFGTTGASYSNWSGGAPYATNPGSFSVPRAELVSTPAYVYDPSTGTYRMTTGGG